MNRSSRIPRVALFLLGSIWMVAAAARFVHAQPATPHFSEGQKIEVREGDTWSAATIVKQEGRKYLIHYSGADATADEWVTTDRMRAPGASAATTTMPAAGPRKFFPNGLTVEVKTGPWWKKAVVVNHRGEWILVDIDGKRFWRQWVEPWRVRSIGSTDDIEGWAKDNPWVHHNEEPPRPVPGPPPEPASHAEPGRPRRPGAPEGNEQKPQQLGRLEPLTNLPADPAWPVKTVAGPIALQNTAGTPQAIIVSTRSAVAAVLYPSQKFGNEATQSSTVERVDLTTGRSLGISSLPIDADLLDLSADGKLLLTRTSLSGSEGHGGQMDVWDLGAPSLVRIASFVPFPERNESARFIEWGRFIDQDHVLAAGNGIACYEFRKQQQVWWVDAGPFISHYALSPTCKYLTVPTGFGLGVLDAHTGSAIGKIDLEVRFVSSMSFRRDGRELVAAGTDSVAVIDLANCSVAAEVWTMSGAAQRIDWAADGYLLLNHSRLISLAKNAVVWTYGGLSSNERESRGAVLNDRLYYVSDRDRNGQRRGPVLTSVALPDKSVTDVLSVVGNPRMLLKPGMSVSMDVNVDGSIGQAVIDGLTARLKANGISVADSQPVKVVAKDEPGKTREVSYNLMGPGAMGRTDKVSVQEVHHSLEIIGPDDKPLWSNKGLTAPPFFISLKQGQSVEQAVSDQMKPNARFYTNAHLPKYIPKPGGGFGTTQLDASGAHP